MTDTAERPLINSNPNVWYGGVWAAESDQGLKREKNEDAWGQRGDLGVWVIADGMGGHSAGERASAIVVQTVLEKVGEGEWKMSDILFEAHRRIKDWQADGTAADMGSTVVVLHLSGNAASVAWVGDSRAYLLRDRILYPLTTDHSYVGMLLSKRLITHEEATDHPQRNIILKAIGTDTFHEPDTKTITITKGDRILLCTDGLTSLVEDDKIASILYKSIIPADGIKNLIKEVNSKGGYDNTTLILVDVTSDILGHPIVLEPTPVILKEERRNKRSYTKGLYAAVVLLFCCIVLFLLWLARPAGKNDLTTKAPPVERIKELKRPGGVER